MQVILLERIRGLGDLGAQVDVKPGFARNFLVPHKKAVFATKDNLAEFEHRRADLEKAQETRLLDAQNRAKAFEGLVLTLNRKASEEGKLFGSVSLFDLIDLLKEQGLAVEKRELLLPAGTIRSVGEYDLDLVLHADVAVRVKVVIQAA